MKRVPATSIFKIFHEPEIANALIPGSRFPRKRKIVTAKLITRARITEEERGGKDIYIYIFNKKGRERVLIFILINFVKFHVVITRPFVSPF